MCINDVVCSVNLFINLSIFIEFFSNSKSAPLISSTTDTVLPVLRPHQTSPKRYLRPASSPSWRGVRRIALEAVERIPVNAGKCLLRHGCGGQFRLRREKITDRGETVDSDQGGAVEKPLVGRMAFTPLTRGARGVGFQPREGERDG